MELRCENFGGFSSELGFDFAAKYTDYVICASFTARKDYPMELCDEEILIESENYAEITRLAKLHIEKLNKRK